MWLLFVVEQGKTRPDFVLGIYLFFRLAFAKQTGIHVVVQRGPWEGRFDVRWL